MNYHSEAQRISSEIKRLFDLGIDVPMELQASLARYACVLTSSYLEASLRAELLNYANTRVHDQYVVAFVKASLRRLENPNFERILDLVGRFGSDIKQSLADCLEGKHRTSVNSVNANRNLIVHGKNSGISLAYVKQYYGDAEDVVEKIRRVLSNTFDSEDENVIDEWKLNSMLYL